LYIKQGENKYNKTAYNWDSSVGTAMGFELDGRVSIPGRNMSLFPTRQLPDRLWDPARLLSNGYHGIYILG
jgi:hypothetical protein